VYVYEHDFDADDDEDAPLEIPNNVKLNETKEISSKWNLNLTRLF